MQIIIDEPSADAVFKSFKGNELISAEQEAIEYLKKLDEDKREF